MSSGVRRLLGTGLVGATVGIAVALSGCSDSTSKPATSVPGAGPIATAQPSSPTSSPAASGTTSSGSGSSGSGSSFEVPAEAKVRTADGAVTFVRHFLWVSNESSVHPRSGALSPMSTQDCTSCAGIEEQTQHLIQRGWRYNGPPLDIKDVAGIVGKPEVDPRFDVAARVLEGASDIVDGSGQVVQPITPTEATLVLELVWLDGAWKVDKIKLLDTGK